MNAAALCELAEAYAIGALDEAEARQFEAHLASCDACPAVVRDYRELALALAAGTSAVEPPPRLRERVLAAAHAAAPPRAARSRWMPLALAAGIAAALLAGAQTVRLARLSGRLAATVDTLAARDARLHVLEERQNAILDDATEMYRIAPTADATAPRSGGQVFWRRDQQTWLVHVFELPRLPEGRAYQLWFVAGGRAVPAGLIATDPEGHGIVVVPVPEGIRNATHAAVSVEPEGGSPQPTGPIVLLGSVTSE
jgi:anti-sigma-K factor RskA